MSFPPTAACCSSSLLNKPLVIVLDGLAQTLDLTICFSCCYSRIVCIYVVLQLRNSEFIDKFNSFPSGHYFTVNLRLESLPGLSIFINGLPTVIYYSIELFITSPFELTSSDSLLCPSKTVIESSLLPWSNDIASSLLALNIAFKTKLLGWNSLQNQPSLFMLVTKFLPTQHTTTLMEQLPKLSLWGQHYTSLMLFLFSFLAKKGEKFTPPWTETVYSVQL